MCIRDRSSHLAEARKQAEAAAADMASPWGASAMLRLAHKNAVEQYKHVHLANSRMAKATSAVEKLHRDRICQQMELLIAEAQVTQITGQHVAPFEG